MRAYQDYDGHIVDYDLTEVAGLSDWGAHFRGPQVDGSPAIACVGAAQTFGRLCELPYPRLLNRALGTAVLNLGVGGAGPGLFMRPDFLAAINRAPVVVVQVLSARSQSTSEFRTEGNMQGIRTRDGQYMVAEELFEDLLREADAPTVASSVRDFQEAYIADMKRLLAAIDGFTILFWFSVRSPAYLPSLTSVEALFGAFPQLVTPEMLHEITACADSYVECTTRVGLPRRLLDKNGDRASIELDYRIASPQKYVVTTDNYYPSPEMHRVAAASLTPACREGLRRQGRNG